MFVCSVFLFVFVLSVMFVYSVIVLLVVLVCSVTVFIVMFVCSVSFLVGYVCVLHYCFPGYA